MSERSPRGIIRDMWRDRIDGAETVDTAAVAAEIVAELVEDPAFCRAYAETFLLDTVTTIGHILFKQDKERIRSGVLMQTPAAIRESVRQEIASSFADWRAWVPTEKVRISLPEMTKEQLLDACRDERAKGETAIKTAEWYRLIAGRLQPGQRVREVWKDDELADLQQRLNVKIKTGLNGIQAPTAHAADY